MITRISCRCYI